MQRLEPLDHWDPISLTALVWAKQVLSSNGLTQSPPRRLWERASHDHGLVRAALSYHRLIPAAATWLTSQSERSIPHATSSWLHSERRRIRLQVVTHAATAGEIQRVFADAGVQALFVKGSFQAKQAIGDPAGREPGDLDVLVGPVAYDRAIDALLSMGAVRAEPTVGTHLADKVSRVHHATTFTLAGTSIDLHRRLDPNPDRMRLGFADLWAERDEAHIAGEAFATLSPIDACLFVASHGGRDGWLQIRQLVDFAVSLHHARIADPGMDTLRRRASQQGISGRLAVALAVTRLVVPEIPPQPPHATRLASWTRSRYRAGTVITRARTGRHAVSVFTYSMLTERSISDLVFAARRLTWFTSTNTEPAIPNLPVWAYPLMTPVNVARRVRQLPSTETRVQRPPSDTSSTRARTQVLFRIAMNPQDLDIYEAWQDWRMCIPDLNGITPDEMSALPVAWATYRAAGGSDPDSGRLMGVLRRSSVHATSVLAECARVQHLLAERGIRSQLTGAAAAALHYPHLSRWSLGRAELWISQDDINSAIAHRTRSVFDGVIGRHIMDDASGLVALTWRYPPGMQNDYACAAPSSVEWQGRQLWIAEPDIVAMHILRQAVLTSPPGRGASLTALLDLSLLSRNSRFDRDRFLHLRRRFGWMGMVAAHTRACRGLLSSDLVNLLSDSAAVGPRRLDQIAQFIQDIGAHVTPKATRFAVRTLS